MGLEVVLTRWELNLRLFRTLDSPKNFFVPQTPIIIIQFCIKRQEEEHVLAVKNNPQLYIIRGSSWQINLKFKFFI